MKSEIWVIMSENYYNSVTVADKKKLKNVWGIGCQL